MGKFTETPQWTSGYTVERYLDQFFAAQGWSITQTTPHQERVLCLGDRIYTGRDGKAYFVEYKSGLQTIHTGNVFLETISVDSSNRPGWVYTCRADYLFYAALNNHKILIFLPVVLRRKMDYLKTRFREVGTSHQQNSGYNTHGLIVPLPDAELLAEKIIRC